MYEYARETLKERIEKVRTDKWMDDKDANYYISELQSAIELLKAGEGK